MRAAALRRPLGGGTTDDASRGVGRRAFIDAATAFLPCSLVSTLRRVRRSDESVVRASSDPSIAEFSPPCFAWRSLSHVRVVRCSFSARTAAGASGRPGSASSSGKSLDLP